MPAKADPVIFGDPAGEAPHITFDAMYQQLWWPMVRTATALVHDVGLAEDIVQDAFAAVYRRWDAINDRAASVGYLRAAVVNGARSSLRRRATARKHLRVVADETAEAADHTTLLGAEHTMVHNAMNTLPERQREVLTLRYVAELSDADIARATGLSEGGVRSAASRGLAALRSTLGTAIGGQL